MVQVFLIHLQITGNIDMISNLYKIIIVMRRETFIVYRHAFSEKQAKLAGSRAVAKKHGVLPVVVNSYLKEHPDCWKVSIETEYKETDDE